MDERDAVVDITTSTGNGVSEPSSSSLSTLSPSSSSFSSSPSPSSAPARSTLLPQRKGYKLTSGEVLDIVEVIKNAGKTFARCFLVSLLTKSSLSILTALIKGRKLKLSLLDWRFGMFLGSFSGSFKALHGILKVIRRKDDVIGSAISGGIAGLSLFCLPSEDRATWCLYTFVRSCEFLAKVLAKRGKIPSILSNFPYWDVLLMYLSAGQILYAFIYERATLNPSYRKFLIHHGGKPTPVVYTYRNLHFNQPLDFPALKKIYPNLNLEQIVESSARAVEQGLESRYALVCKLTHPGRGCVEQSFHFFLEGFRRAISVYVPIHGVYSVIVLFSKLSQLRKARRARNPTEGGNENQVSGLPSENNKLSWCLKQLGEVFIRFIQNLARSSAFLSLYCTLAWAGVCIENHNFLLPNGPLLVSRAMLAIGGLSVLVEAKARRMELALYCLPYALESGWKSLVQSGHVKNVPHGDIGLFCLATAVLVSTFHHQRDVIKPSFRSVFEWLWS